MIETIEDLRKSPFFPGTPENLVAAKRKIAPLMQKKYRRAGRAGRKMTRELKILWDTLFPGHGKTVPDERQMIAAAALLYFLLPEDAIPDRRAGVGYFDDSTVVSMTAQWLTRNEPTAETAE